MKRLEVRLTSSPTEERTVGLLIENQGKTFFQYDAQYLKTGAELSPLHLPLQPDLIEHRDSAFGPLPGLFDDSLPDGWGLLLMDRHFQSKGMDLHRVSPLDRLSWLGTRTMGALTYHPPTVREDADDAVFDLHDLAKQSEMLLSGEAREVLPQLLRAGGSPAGARPKVLIGLRGKRIISGSGDLPSGFQHWMVKFSSKGDGADAGAVEYAYAKMAARAGLEMAETRLLTTSEGDRFFACKRFDRAAVGRRVHVHSFGNLIQSNFRVPTCDYAQLLKATRMLTKNHSEVRRAFRQMVFNVAAHNRDDHVKNFAFVLDAETREWRLSPAYDLTWTPGPGGEHTMTVAGEGKAPGMVQIRAVGEQAGIELSDMNEMVVEVSEAVGRMG